MDHTPTSASGTSRATLPPPPPFIFSGARQRPGVSPWKVVGEVVLGLGSSGFGVLASIVVLFVFGTYDRSNVTPENVRSAHEGQLALLVVAVLVSVPWLVASARRRSLWQLQLVVGLASAVVPLLVLSSHLHVTDWPQPFVF